MQLEIVFSHETFRAAFAAERILLGVETLVPNEVTCGGKSDRANVAGVRFLAGVGTDVPHQVAGCYERFAALRALEWFGLGVNSRVDLQLGRVGESFLASVADVGLFLEMFKCKKFLTNTNS